MAGQRTLELLLDEIVPELNCALLCLPEDVILPRDVQLIGAQFSYPNKIVMILQSEDWVPFTGRAPHLGKLAVL